MTASIIIWIGVAWIAGWLAFFRVPFLQKPGKKSKRYPTLSIIVPARNEADTLPHLLTSIRKQTLQPLEVVVIDDHSEDDTRHIAQEYGATVLGSKGEGKAAACWQGAQAAKGDWLLFLDADTFFQNAASLANILSQYQEMGGKGILSAQPFHRTQQLYEQLSFVFNIIIMAGLNAFAAFSNRIPVSGAFGPCILCSKEDYATVDGHKGMPAGILDDIGLAERFSKKGYPIHLFGGKGTIAFRMHPAGIQQLLQGWSKDFAKASQQTHPAVLLCIILWISGGIGAGISWIVVTPMIALLLYSLYFLQCLSFASRVGNFHPVVLLGYPVLFLFFLLLFTWSLLRTYLFRSVTWKGRNVKL